MKDFLKVTAGTLAIIAVILGLSWIFMGNEFFLQKYFAPKQEALRREVFEESKAYNQGVVQELNKAYTEYQAASPEHQEALKAVILHTVSDYPTEKLPPHLRMFVLQLQNQKFNK